MKNRTFPQSLRLIPLVALAVSLNASTGMGAPACSSVFQKTSTRIENGLPQFIQNLAQLKFELDLAKAQGRKSPLTGRLEGDYQVRLSELVNAGYSKTEIRRLISQQIQHFQKLAKNDLEIEVQKREPTGEILSITKPYVLESTTRLYGHDWHSEDFVYLPELNSVMNYTNNGIYVLSLATGKPTVSIAMIQGARVTADRLKIWAVDTTFNKLKLIDLKDGKELLTLPGEFELSNEGGIALSPDESLMVIPVQDQIAKIVNLKTGAIQEVKSFETPAQFYGGEKAIFIDDQNIIFIRPAGISKLDLSTGKLIEQANQGSSNNLPILSEDKRTLLTYSADGTLYFDTQTLSVIAEQIYKKDGWELRFVRKIPGTDLIIRHLENFMKREDVIATDEAPLPFRTGDVLPAELATRGLSFSPDGKTAVVLHYNDVAQIITKWKAP
jgi:hypothetical protein